MARRPSFGELVLGGSIVALVALVGFVAAQVVALPRRTIAARTVVLSGRDSASIAASYRAQVSAKRPAYEVPDWLARIHVARLQAAAVRDAERDATPAMLADSMRAVIAAGASGTYFDVMVADDDSVVTRWRASDEPIRVWVQPQSAAAGFSPELISPTRRAFTAWNELALGAQFAIVDDSTDADVHVTWSAAMPKRSQIGTTFRMTGGAGYIVFAHVILSTAYDIYTVQNAARHEAGHVLGLDHSPDSHDIMAAETEGRQYQLTDADRRTAALLYRLAPGKLR